MTRKKISLPSLFFLSLIFCVQAKSESYDSSLELEYFLDPFNVLLTSNLDSGDISKTEFAPDWGFVVNNPELGHHLCPIGDINGDGYSDILISVAENEYGDTSYLKVIYGFERVDFQNWNLSDLLESRSSSFLGDVNAQKIVAEGLGDINGDGQDDFALLEYFPQENSSSARVGKISVMYGRKDIPGQTIDFSNLDEDEGFIITGFDTFNFRKIIGLGDFNGDHVDDFALSFVEYIGTIEGCENTFSYGLGYNHGVLVVTGKQSMLEDFDLTASDRPGYLFYNNHPISKFGNELAAGDVNGDGLADLIVGAPHEGVIGTYPCGQGDGALYSIQGQLEPVDSSEVFKFTGGGGSWISWAGSPEPGFSLGTAIGVGDVNNDGFDDIIATAPDDGSVPFLSIGPVGSSHIYLGSSEGLSSQPEIKINGKGESSMGGISVDLLDMTNSGFADLVVRHHSLVGFNVGLQLYYSPVGRQLLHPDDIDGKDGVRFNFPVSDFRSIGDFNGDGITDLVFLGNDSDPDIYFLTNAFLEKINYPPYFKKKMLQVLLKEGDGDLKIALAEFVGDREGDILTFSVSAKNEDLQFELHSDTLLLNGPSVGVEYLTLTVADVINDPVVDTLKIILDPAPVRLDDQKVLFQEGFGIDSIAFDSIYVIQEGLEISYSLLHVDSVVTVNLSSAYLKIIEKGFGAGNIVLELQDALGGSIVDSLKVFVNRPPAIDVSIDSILLYQGFEIDSINLGPHFSDPDGGTLGFTMNYSFDFVDIMVNDSMLYLIEGTPGEGGLKIIVNDDHGGAVDQRVKLIVFEVLGPSEAFSDNLLLAPNPTADFVSIKTGSNVSDLVKIYNQQGQLVDELPVDNGLVDCRHLAKGIYLLFLEVDGRNTVARLIKD